MRNSRGSLPPAIVMVLATSLNCVGDAPVFPEDDADAAVDGAEGQDSDVADADTNAEPADLASDGLHPCDPTAAFTIIEPITELNGATDDEAPRLTPDELVIYMTRRTGQGQPFQIYVAKRASRDAAFGMAMPIPLLANASGATIAPDQSSLYYSSDRGGADPNAHLYVARPPFSVATSIAISELNSVDSDDYAPFVSADDKELYFVSDRPAGADDDDIYVAPRIDGKWTQPIAVAAANSSTAERSPVLSADGLRLYFGSTRAKANDFDIYVAHRSERSGTFEAPSPVGDLNTPSFELPDWISPDDCTLYFRTDRPGGSGGRDIWRARRR